MARVSIKGGSTTVPKPKEHADFVLGSRPAVLRAPALSRIAPKAKSTRDYGKEFANVGSGTTGIGGQS